MGRIHQARTENQYSSGQVFDNKFAAKDRPNLNNLLKKRQDEKNSDKKTKVIVWNSVGAISRWCRCVLDLSFPESIPNRPNHGSEREGARSDGHTTRTVGLGGNVNVT